MLRFSLFIVLIGVSLFSSGQRKDSLKLICPLNEAVEPPAEKQPYSLGVHEVKMTLASPTDTTVKACMGGTVTNVMRDEDGSYMVMFNSKDYYFLYSGITKASVRKGQRVGQGEMLGVLKPGGRLDFQIYDFETPLDPRKYVACIK